jgi:hypothetical protein
MVIAIYKKKILASSWYKKKIQHHGMIYLKK